MTGDRRSSHKILLPLICLTILLGILVAGLWPFRFRPVNNVRWIKGEPGLRFEDFGIAYSKAPLFGPGGPVDLASPFAIRMEVRPHAEPSDSLPRILSAYDARGRELFFLGQWKSELILRILKEERDFRIRTRETGADGLQKDVTRSIVVRSDINSLTLFVDGMPARTSSGVNFSLLTDKRSPARIILGNSPFGDSPWRGDLLSLSFFMKALSPGEIETRETAPVIRYDFSEGTGSVCRNGVDPRYDLTLPAIFRAPEKGILVPPWRVQNYNRTFWIDVMVNILGFLPFGFAVYAWLGTDGHKKPPWMRIAIVLSGAGISFFIELMQVYLPTRDSSLTDLINNIIGTYIGASLYRKTF